MAKIWTVLRHPGRGGRDAWKRWDYETAKLGHDPAEDLARRRFETIASKLKNGVVALAADGRVIEEKAPDWAEIYIRSRLANLPEPQKTGDVRRLFSHH